MLRLWGESLLGCNYVYDGLRVCVRTRSLLGVARGRSGHCPGVPPCHPVGTHWADQALASWARAPAKSRSAPNARTCLSLESGSRPGLTRSRGAGPRRGVIGQMGTNRDFAGTLTKPSPAARGMVAAAMFAPGRSRLDSWSPAELEDEWLDAIELLDPAATLGHQDYEAAQLTQFLATHYPDRLARWVRSRLEAHRAPGRLHDALPHSAWESLHHLPIEQKDELWSHFFDEPVARWLLGEHFVSEDTSWLEHALDHTSFPPIRHSVPTIPLGLIRL